MLEIRVANRYRLGKKIGNGSFGEIFLGISIENNEEVAIKLESCTSRHPQLTYESKLLRLMAESEGIPEMIWFGSEGGYNILVMELLGPSLEDLFVYCNRKFSMKTSLMIGKQLLERVETMHKKSFIHRDLKPDNFLIGLGAKANAIYMIDFGLAKKYRDPRNYNHIPYKDGKNLTGTARYASINTHLGIEQSRRDDIESIYYMLAYFLLGSLPWQGVVAETKYEKYEKILEKKKSSVIDNTYEALPHELVMLFTYCRSLKFEEKPDYVYLKALLNDICLRESYSLDSIFDWTIKNYSTHRQLKPRLLDDLHKESVNESKFSANNSRAVNLPPPIQSVQQNKQNCLIS